MNDEELQTAREQMRVAIVEFGKGAFTANPFNERKNGKTVLQAMIRDAVDEAFRMPTFDVEGPREEPPVVASELILPVKKTFVGKYKTRRQRGKKRGKRLRRRGSA